MSHDHDPALGAPDASPEERRLGAGSRDHGDPTTVTHRRLVEMQRVDGSTLPLEQAKLALCT